MHKVVFLSLCVALSLSSVAEAKRLKIGGSAVSASSSYPPEDGATYDARLLVDGKQGTAWVEGDKGSGLGSWVELDLGGTKTVTKLRIWPGYWFDSNSWQRSNRPKEIELSFDDGATQKITLADEMKFQDFEVKSKKTAKVKLKIKQIHNGSAWPDTAISEVQVFDTSADEAIPVRAYSASSKLPADADGNYEPDNVGDGLADSMWCEANKDGDGTGEWIDFQLSGSHTVSSMQIINGIGTGLKYYLKGNRPATARLTFSDGASETIQLKTSFMAQPVKFAPHKTTSVRMTFESVSKGKEYNDLCISEAVFK